MTTDAIRMHVQHLRCLIRMLQREIEALEKILGPDVKAECQV